MKKPILIEYIALALIGSIIFIADIITGCNWEITTLAFLVVFASCVGIYLEMK